MKTRLMATTHSRYFWARVDHGRVISVISWDPHYEARHLGPPQHRRRYVHRLRDIWARLPWIPLG